MIQPNSRLFSYFFLVLVAIPVKQVTAQDVLEEVLVTAQRREQSLQEVPISITAYSAAQIEQNNWKGARDFILMTPNVSFSENDAQGNKNGDIAIRGLSDLTSGGDERIIQARPTVGYFVDDFSVAGVASGSANPPLDDIERIEILRGPQGTYFGRNATGGAINIVSKKPNEERMGKIKVGVGNFGAYEVGVLANVPITDNLFMRGGVVFETGDGIIDNLSPTGNDADYDNLNLRVALRWQPGDWTFDVTGQKIKEELGNQGGIPTGVAPTGFLGFGPGADPLDAATTCGLGADIIFQDGNDDKICEDQDTFHNIDNKLITLKAVHQGDRFTFTSITGRLESKLDQLNDLDGSGFDIFNRLNSYDSESWSQEIRLSSADDWQLFDRPFTWTVGGIYYDDEFQANNTIISGADTVPGFTGFLTVPGDHPNENSQNVRRDGWAVFVDFSMDVVENVTLSVGGRYSEDDDKQFWRDTFATFDCGSRAAPGGIPDALAPGCVPRADQLPLTFHDAGDGALFVTGGRYAQTLFTDNSTSGSDFSPRVALNWNVNDDHSFYATFSQGYRAAGTRAAPDSNGLVDQLNPAGAADTRSEFDKEKITNYELGWKGYANNRRTQIEAAIFRMDWDDMQVRLDRFQCQLADGTYVDFASAAAIDCVTGPQPDNRIFNAKSARSQGLELSIQSLVGQNFILGGSVGYLDAEFIDFKNSTFGDVTGKRLPNAPKYSVALMAQVNGSFGNAESYLRLEANHRSGTYTRFNDVNNPDFPFQTDDFTVVNLRAGLEWKNQNFNLSVSNLFEEEYTLGVDDFSLPGAQVLPHPRIIRLTWTMTTDF